MGLLKMTYTITWDEKSYLFGFTYSDYVGDLCDRKSTTRCAFMMGSTIIS